MKLDIGGGESHKGGGKWDGWVTIDLNRKADIVHDITKVPWPIRAGSVSGLRFFHTLEHLPPVSAFPVMKECYRIAEPGAIMEVRVPWWKYDQYTHPLHLNSFRPRWFYWLSKVPQETKGEKDNIGDRKYCAAMDRDYQDIDWRVMRDEVTRGDYKFWKKYQYTVWLVKYPLERI